MNTSDIQWLIANGFDVAELATDPSQPRSDWVSSLVGDVNTSPGQPPHAKTCLLAARLAMAAYWQPDKLEAACPTDMDFTWIEDDSRDIQIGIYQNDELVLTFPRGSQFTFRDWLNNCLFWPQQIPWRDEVGMRGHGGYIEAIETILQPLTLAWEKSTNAKHHLLAGHSQGGGQAALLADYADYGMGFDTHSILAVTFGQPRVWHYKTAPTVRTRVARIIHPHDGVPAVPLPIQMRHAPGLLGVADVYVADPLPEPMVGKKVPTMHLMRLVSQLAQIALELNVWRGAVQAGKLASAIVGSHPIGEYEKVMDEYVNTDAERLPAWLP